MSLEYIVERYEHLIKKADNTFEETAEKYKEYVQCALHCADCCYAMFGLFLIEAFCIKQEFDKLPSDIITAALERAKKADQDLKDVELQLRKEKEESESKSSKHHLSRIRIRCPLLDENDECIVYEHRPLTCRVYGIPTSIRGKAHVCGKSKFERGKYYPVYNLDEAYQELYYLSRQLLGWKGSQNLDKASLLLSVSKSISTPTDELIEEVFE